MSLDSTLLTAFLSAFVRMSAILLASPLFTLGAVPVRVRVLFSVAMAMVLAPNLTPYISVPASLPDLLLLVAQEVGIGLFIGFLTQSVLWAAEFAGAFLDLHVGFGMAAVLAPNVGLPASVIARFKVMLAGVLFLTLNGHHLIINAFLKSYQIPPFEATLPMIPTLLQVTKELSLLALQMAIPVGAVALVVDAGLGLVSRAAPQVNVLMLGISAKLMVGLIALTVGLPAFAYGVQQGMAYTVEVLTRWWGR
jgi:flagellar biosynthetic protein FliR